MKKIVLLFSALVLLSCNKNDEPLSLENSADIFLLEQITYDIDNIEVPFDLTYKYEYNADNDPIALYSNNGSTNQLRKMLEFNYTNGTLTEIIHLNKTHQINGQNIVGYIKHSFSYFNSTGSASTSAFYDTNDVLIHRYTLEVTFTFSGNLIKSLKLQDFNYLWVNNYSHDSDGKLVQISMNQLYGDPIIYGILNWDTNPNIDTLGPLDHTFGSQKFWFPNHYISTKNPLDYYVNSTGVNEDISVLYQYDTNGNIEEQIQTYGGLNHTRIIAKKYIPGE